MIFEGVVGNPNLELNGIKDEMFPLRALLCNDYIGRTKAGGLSQ